MSSSKMSDQDTCVGFALIQDVQPPWDSPLSCKYKRSFAYDTAKDRWPVILGKVIDGLSNNKEDIAAEYGEQGKEDVENILNYLLTLKDDMNSDRCFVDVVHGDDASVYNTYLSNKRGRGSPVSWYSTEWLYAECYLYRRIKEAFLSSKKLINYDPFHQQKTEAIEEGLKAMEVLASFLLHRFREQDLDSKSKFLTFQRMLKLSLWSNKADLSLSCGSRVEVEADPLKTVDELDDFILSDDSHAAWTEISNSKSPIIGKWVIYSDYFWTQPFSYNEMKEQEPKLYSLLAESSLIIFKGDLNYRKLLGDINWKYTTPFHAALRGFHPAPIVALRTAKADLIAGLDPQVSESFQSKDIKWLLTGSYGIIQFDNANSKVGCSK